MEQKRLAISLIILVSVAILLSGCTGGGNAYVCNNNDYCDWFENEENCPNDCSEDTNVFMPCEDYTECSEGKSCTNQIDEELFCEDISIDPNMLGLWYGKINTGEQKSTLIYNFTDMGDFIIDAKDTFGNILHFENTYTVEMSDVKKLKISPGDSSNRSPYSEGLYGISGSQLTIHMTNTAQGIILDRNRMSFCGDAFCDEIFDENNTCPEDCVVPIEVSLLSNTNIFSPNATHMTFEKNIFGPVTTQYIDSNISFSEENGFLTYNGNVTISGVFGSVELPGNPYGATGLEITFINPIEKAGFYLGTNDPISVRLIAFDAGDNKIFDGFGTAAPNTGNGLPFVGLQSNSKSIKKIQYITQEAHIVVFSNLYFE
jgi:hypothetical protein